MKLLTYVLALGLIVNMAFTYLLMEGKFSYFNENELDQLHQQANRNSQAIVHLKQEISHYHSSVAKQENEHSGK